MFLPSHAVIMEVAALLGLEVNTGARPMAPFCPTTETRASVITLIIIRMGTSVRAGALHFRDSRDKSGVLS